MGRDVDRETIGQPLVARQPSEVAFNAVQRDQRTPAPALEHFDPGSAGGDRDCLVLDRHTAMPQIRFAQTLMDSGGVRAPLRTAPANPAPCRFRAAPAALPPSSVAGI